MPNKIPILNLYIYLQGRHGDLTSEESQILLAEFFLRHRESTISIVHEYAKRKVDKLTSLNETRNKKE